MVFTTSATIVVGRELENGTNLMEFWEMKRYSWDKESVDDPVVKCYITHVNDWDGSVPHQKYSVTDTVCWSDMPEEIQQEFLDEMGRINNRVRYPLTVEVEE